MRDDVILTVYLIVEYLTSMLYLAQTCSNTLYFKLLSLSVLDVLNAFYFEC